MKNKVAYFITITALLLGGIVLWYKIPTIETPSPAPHVDAKNLTYKIEGKDVKLVNGYAETEIAPGSAARSVTRYFGNEAIADLNGDGTLDTAFLLTQSSGGSGTFYYLAAALKTPTGSEGTNTIFLGDRIAPQTTEFRDGKIIVNFATRGPGEPMTENPSVGVSKYFKIENGSLVEYQ